LSKSRAEISRLEKLVLNLKSKLGSFESQTSSLDLAYTATTKEMKTLKTDLESVQAEKEVFDS